MYRLSLLLCLVSAAFAVPAAVNPAGNDLRAYRDFLEKTVQGDGETLESRMAKNPKAKAWENSGKFQGDVLLDEKQIQDMVTSQMK